MRKLAILLLGLLAAAACRKREYVGPHGEKVEYDAQGKNVTVKTADGSVVVSGEGVKIPEDFPKDVGSSRVDLQACKLEYSIVSPK